MKRAIISGRCTGYREWSVDLIGLNEIVESSSNDGTYAKGCNLLLNGLNRTKCLVGLVFRLYLIKINSSRKSKLQHPFFTSHDPIHLCDFQQFEAWK